MRRGGARRRKFSKERIKAEMNEAKWNSWGLAFVAGLLAFIAIGLTFAAAQPYVSSEARVIVVLLWIGTLALVYGAWKYDQRYKKWKSML